MVRQWRRVFSLLCALAALAGLVSVPASAVPETGGGTYEYTGSPAPDVPAGSWYAADAAVMVEQGMMFLNEAGQFEPGRNITRAEVCYALWKLADGPQAVGGAVERLKDVSPDTWWYTAVAWAAGEGIVEGYSDNTFRPNQALTRAQMAAFLGRYALRYGYATEQDVENARKNAEPFVDEANANSIFLRFIYWARAHGYISGYSDKTFKPYNLATRAHAAAILNRFLSFSPRYAASSIPDSGDAFLLSGAVYPSMIQYPRNGDFSEAYQRRQSEWLDAVRAQRQSLTKENAAQMRGFFERSMGQFLQSDGQRGQNRVFSPMNVYMALAMLAECAEGETRAQILSALGAESVEALREQANQAWNAYYRDDGAVASILGNSLWLNSALLDAAPGAASPYQADTLETLKDTYFASVYAGDAASPAYSQAFRDWLNAQTGGLLEGAASRQTFDEDMAAAIASTLNFRAKWDGQFDKSKTTEAVFHAPDGDVTTAFMRQDGTDTYYWGEKFAAVYKNLASGGMWFFLPDEGVTPEDLLDDQEVMDLLFSGGWGLSDSMLEKQVDIIVHKRIPKFDITTTVPLISGLEGLGVTDVFSPERADLSNLVQLPVPVYVNQANHAVRAVIDEEGCTAVAFTIFNIFIGAARPPEEEVDFTLDRPFLFCVTGTQNLPLFAGIVYNPAEP